MTNEDIRLSLTGAPLLTTRETQNPSERTNECTQLLSPNEKRKNEYQSLSEAKTENGDATQLHNTPSSGLLDAFMVAMASFYLVFIFYSTWTSFGIYLLQFQEQFPVYKSFCSWLLALQNICAGVTGIVSGKLVEKLGTRIGALVGSALIAGGFALGAFVENFYLLGFCYSVLIGIGNNFTFMSATVTTQQYFTNRRALASGFIMTGGGIAMFICPPLTAYVINSWGGWRASFLLQSALALHGLPMGMLLRPKPSPSTLRQPKEPSQTDERNVSSNTMKNSILSCRCSMLTNKTFLLLLVGSFCLLFAQETPTLFNVALAVDLGIPLQQASFILSAWAIASIPARYVIGWLADKFRSVTMTALSCLMTAVSIILIAYCKSLSTQLIVATMYGFSLAGFMTVLSPAFVEVLGEDNIPASQSLYIMIFGFSGSLGPIASSLVVEATGSYTLSFLASGILGILGGVLLLISAVLNILNFRRNNNTTNRDEDTKPIMAKNGD